MEQTSPIQTKSHRKSIFFAGTFLLILLLLFLARMFLAEIKRDSPKESPVLQVVTKVIQPNTDPITLILPASAQAWHDTPLWGRVNGYVVRYLVDIGDRVNKGDLLAEIDTPETDRQVDQARADLANAQAEKNIAAITQNRWQTLWDKNKEAVSKQEVDQYNSNYQSAEAVVIANEENLAKLLAQQEFKFIYAPFSGIITERKIDIGSLITGDVNGAEQEIFRIAESNLMRFFVDVPQTYFRQITEGLDAEVTVTQLPGIVFPGKISRYAKALNPIARTLMTQVDVENKDGILYPGLFARVKFTLQHDTVSFIIPTTSIIVRSGYTHVAVVNPDNTIHLQRVEIGLDYGKQVEIISGLKNNDRIVIIPSDGIHEGTKVDPTDAKPLPK